jgi:subtilase family serine protease
LNFGVAGANGFRAVPDVSFDADPNTGVGVYDTTPYNGFIGWFQVGGTSLGAPSWAAISSLGMNVNLTSMYKDAKNALTYPLDFRDITIGSNGSCGFYCTSLPGYDYVTGLGSPLTSSY